MFCQGTTSVMPHPSPKALALATEGVRIKQSTTSAPKGEMLYGIFGTAEAVPFQNCFDYRAKHFSQHIEFCNSLKAQCLPPTFADVMQPCIATRLEATNHDLEFTRQGRHVFARLS